MIELAEARKLLKRAMETQGRDFVYNPNGLHDCFYKACAETDSVPDSMKQTGCLVGTALDFKGETRHHDPGAWAPSAGSSIGQLSKTYRDMLSEDAASHLGLAQREQDNGSTWGAAYDAAEAWAKGRQ